MTPHEGNGSHAGNGARNGGGREHAGGASIVREEVLEPLRRVLRWTLSLRDAQGRIVCPEHRVEHTGKSACVAILAAELSRLDPDPDGDELFEVAVQQGRRLVANLEREGTSPCHTFRPGRHDPFNCSNSVIDGGACSDALAWLVTEHGARLEAADREAFRYASVLHARTYLRYAVVDKGIPAQRAWGLTGLAGALALEPADPERMQRAALEAVAELERIQHGDGSYPYHPLEWGAEHPGASDVSAYYQSRVTGFLLFAFERLGLDPRADELRGPLLRGLEFLLALQGPDGVKCGLVEAKPWYWGATYEVASHPFDVHALAVGARRFRGDERAAALAARAGDGALRAFRAWRDHLSEDGAPRSHLPGHGRGRSYQCPLFWAAHACWIARAAPELERLLAEEGEPASATSAHEGALDLRVAYFPHASLARLEDGRVVAWIRGARPKGNVHHGSPHGAGLLRCVRVADGADLVARCRLGGAQQGEWSGKAGGWSPARGLRAGRREVAFALWLARVHWRAGRVREALLAVPRTFARGVLAFAHPRVSSAFDLAPVVVVMSDGIALRSQLAHRDGSVATGSDLERVFRIDGEGLEVAEDLASTGAARGVAYVVPPAASDVARTETKVRYRLA